LNTYKNKYISELFKAIYIFNISDIYINNLCIIESTGQNKNASNITPLDKNLIYAINNSNDIKEVDNTIPIDDDPSYEEFLSSIDIHED
jgi:hypothetical protein